MKKTTRKAIRQRKICMLLIIILIIVFSIKWAKESNEELTDFTNNCSQKLIQSSSLAALEFKSIVLSM